MYGLFNEMGPFSVGSDGATLVPRAATWNTNYAMVFVDNPVGTGFSYTEDASCFSQNMQDVSENLYAFLVQFFTSYPDYLHVDFYVTGVSALPHTLTHPHTVHSSCCNSFLTP